jgi:hypothetical protein
MALGQTSMGPKTRPNNMDSDQVALVTRLVRSVLAYRCVLPVNLVVIFAIDTFLWRNWLSIHCEVASMPMRLLSNAERRCCRAAVTILVFCVGRFANCSVECWQSCLSGAPRQKRKSGGAFSDSNARNVSSPSVAQPPRPALLLDFTR